MTGPVKEREDRWRTAPPVSQFKGNMVIDGYGFRWCGAGLHIIPDGHRSCKPCNTRRQRQWRGRKT